MIISNSIKQIFTITRKGSYTIKKPIKTDRKVYDNSVRFVSQIFRPNFCWRCGLERKDTVSVFCEQCNTIQNPLETKNYFRLFNLDERFDIDTKELQNKYRTLQSYLHPDKFTNKTDEEKIISANYSSLVNKAYNSLRVPLKRAEHLLEVKGNNLVEEQTLDDSDFLMEMMELNEELDNTSDKEKLKDLNLKNKNKLEMIAKNIDECFKKNDLKQAKYFLIKMKYYSSLGNRINTLLRDLGVVD